MFILTIKIVYYTDDVIFVSLLDTKYRSTLFIIISQYLCTIVSYCYSNYDSINHILKLGMKFD